MKHISLLIITLLFFSTFAKNRTQQISIKINYNTIDRTILNDANVLYWIKYYDIKYPEIVLKQAKLETGNYKSNICLKNNNLFGMRFSWKRQSVEIAEALGHAVYENWIQSILDYKLWQDYNSCLLEQCNGDYYLFLVKSKYATGKRYINYLKKI